MEVLKSVSEQTASEYEMSEIKLEVKYSLQGTTQGNGLTGGLPPVRFSM